jgi:hypothetical protein
MSSAWDGREQAVLLDACNVGGRLLLWDFNEPSTSTLQVLDSGAEFGLPHTIVETEVQGVFAFSNFRGNHIACWRKPEGENGQQLLATCFAGNGTCRNASGPLLGCSIAQPSAIVRVGRSYFVCAQGGAQGGALFLLDPLDGFMAYADMVRNFSESHGIVDTKLRGAEAADVSRRVRQSTCQSVLSANAALSDFCKPWIAARLSIFNGSNALALNGSHASPVAATIQTMLASGEWLVEVLHMITTEFGAEAAESVRRFPATGINNERAIESSFGRLVHGGVTIPAPSLLEYLVARSHDDLSMLRRACSHPALVLLGANFRSTYSGTHDDDDAPLSVHRPPFSRIAHLISTRRDQPAAPPLEDVRRAERFCQLLGGKMPTRRVMDTYRPPSGAKQDVFQPVNVPSENARIGEGVFDRPPTGNAAARTYAVSSRPGSETIQPGHIVLLMPKDEIIGEPYWLAETAELFEVPDEDDYSRTLMRIRYLERFFANGRLFCLGKEARIPMSRILAGSDGELEVHQLSFRAPSPDDRQLKLPTAAVKPMLRLYDISAEQDAAFIKVSQLARSNLAAAAAEEAAERSAAAARQALQDDGEEDEEAELDAAAEAAQAARREAAYGEPEAGGRRRPRPAAHPQSCDKCGPEAGHTTRRCPVMKAERQTKKNEQAAAAAAEVEAAEGKYERAKRARVKENQAKLHTLGLGAGGLQPDV